MRDTWGKTPEAREAWARGGRVGGPIGGRITAEKLRKSPNNEEASVAAILLTFAPEVFADMMWWKRAGSLRGIPDLRHPMKVIGEYDGGAHYIYGDHSASDAAKDTERTAAGYKVIREMEPFILAEKFCYAVSGRRAL